MNNKQTQDALALIAGALLVLGMVVLMTREYSRGIADGKTQERNQFFKTHPQTGCTLIFEDGTIYWCEMEGGQHGN